MNTARGALAEAIGDLVVVDADGQRARLVFPYLHKFVSDPSVAVRTCVAHLLHALLRFDRTRVLESFDALIQSDDRLLAARPVERLLTAISVGSPDKTHPVVARMLKSAAEEVREAGGRLGAVVSLVDRPEPFLCECVTADDAAVRKGAAQVLAHNLRGVSDRGSVTTALTLLLHDGEPTVREAASRFVISLRDEDLEPWAGTLRELLRSPSFDEASVQLLITLEHAPSCPDELILETAQRFLEEYGTAVGDISTRAAADAADVGRLVLRVYARTRRAELRECALDVIDKLLELDAFGFAEVVQGAER